jgi:ABC-type transport system substrate-binding protein
MTAPLVSRRGFANLVLGLFVLGACGGGSDSSSDSKVPNSGAPSTSDSVSTDSGPSGSDATPPDSAATPDPTSPTGGVANDINPQDPANLQSGGELRLPISEIPPNFNYLQLDGTLSDTYDIIEPLMPSTMIAGADAVLTPDPNLLTSVELTSTDPQVLTYTINPKAVWSDGSPITVNDFAANWAAQNATDETFQVSSTSGYEDIASVEAGVDERQVVVTFAKTVAEWKALFSPLYPAAGISTPELFNTGWTEKPLLTAGPFMFDSVDQTAKTVTLVPNPKWWGAKPVLDRVVYRVIDIDAQGQAFANGEIDAIDIGPAVETYKQVQGVSTAKIRQALAPNFRHITFNGAAGSILEDPKLRVAIQKGIDRDLIAQALIGEIMPNAKPLGNHVFTEGTKYYEPHDDVVAYSPDDAKAMLDELGWVQNGEFREKDGVVLEIRDVIPTGVATSASESQLVQAMMAEIGVKWTIDTVNVDEFFETYVNTGDFDVTHFSWIGTVVPVLSSTGIYELPVGDEIQQNYGRIGSAEVDDLFKQANAELDDDKRAALVNQADALIWESGHSLLLYQRPNTVGVTEKLANWGAFGFAGRDWTIVGFLK